MSKIIEGKKDAQGLKIGIVVSRYNHFITEKLLDGALDGFKSHGGDDDQVTIVRVPGAFEIPLIADKLAASGRYDALVCLGAVIRGDTPHFDYVCDAVTRGIGDGSAGSQDSHRLRCSDDRRRAAGDGTRRRQGRQQGL